MKIPGIAPSTPACHVPSVLVTFPCPSSVAVSSPKYQTLPALSCVYQSIVSSTSLPPSYTRSWITTQGTPSISAVSCVTSNTTRDRLPSA